MNKEANNNEKRLQSIHIEIDKILAKTSELEKQYASHISKVNPIYSKSALNLIHYMAFRNFDIDHLQNELRDLGLPSLSNIEAHVKRSLLSIKTIINHLLGNKIVEKQKGIVSFKKSKKLLNRNTKLLFGYKSKKRRTRIMVTLPNTAAEDKNFINRLMKFGMNSARINCAHDDAAIWEKMANNVKEAQGKLNKKCTIMMDLGGPKLRTGSMIEGPKVIHIKPQRDDHGVVINPAKIWIAPADVLPPDDSADVIIPVEEKWFRKMKRGNKISFVDTREKNCKIIVDKKKGQGRWAYSSDSAYIKTGTELKFSRTNKSGNEKVRVGEMLPVEQFISLKIGDKLILHAESIPGETTKYDDQGNLLNFAHVSCTLPEIFKDVKNGEPIFFDDGKIEGIIEEVKESELLIKITYAKDTGGKLKADKGINLPESKLNVSGLTEKDKNDLESVVKLADAVNFSFVNSEEDVQELLTELNKLNAQIGIILKIETQKGFKNLPKILLSAMQTYPIGVMIARGDLAIETGWKNFASIQEEIMRICEAAHVPDVWATQVLENLAKKGVPSRAEITDSAMSQRAECVMLNKGYYIEKAVKMLDKILRRMQNFQKKKETMLPKLEGANELHLSHDKFNI
jgi:pyruvate kinase